MSRWLGKELLRYMQKRAAMAGQYTSSSNAQPMALNSKRSPHLQLTISHYHMDGMKQNKLYAMIATTARAADGPMIDGPRCVIIMIVVFIF